MADLWTATINPKEYQRFLAMAIEDLTTTLADGTRVWQSDSEVLRAHYRRARKERERRKHKRSGCLLYTSPSPRDS